MSLKYTILPTCLVALSCSTQPRLPENAVKVQTPVAIYPDYDDVTIPCNIAPLNFDIRTEGDECISHIHTRSGKGVTVTGRTVGTSIDKWHDMLAEAKGDSIYMDIYIHNSGQWQQHPSVRMAVREEIDPYITYRLIEPSYVNFEVMSINQRCLETYEESEIYNNQPFATSTKGQCINCHSPQDYNRTGRWQMHVRMENGGTLMHDGKELKKLNLKLPETISAGVYPAWHPTLPLIVYSNNKTDQIFHLSDSNKIEVQDNASDLVLYDLENNETSTVAADSTEWETFPAWSPDGQWLYYVSATIPPMTAEEIDAVRNKHYRDIKYNIYRRLFDVKTKTFGPRDTVYMASRYNASATLPRVSPDGRYLLFTQGAYGTFHIWHHDADLYLIDIAGRRMRPLDEVNSTDTESYHSWSSNGRWILFSSRRDDGSYTRLYIAYFDKDGDAHKPFLLPQERPESNTLLFKSYNVPEFAINPIGTSRQEIINALERPALQARYRRPRQ